MPVQVTVQWAGIDAPTYARRFRQAGRIGTFKPVLRKIAVVIGHAIETNFEMGGRPKWAPLAAETLANKIRLGYTSPQAILVATGDLWASATDSSSYRIGRDYIIAKPEPKYWEYHQAGTVKMPQRVIMNMQRADTRKIGGLFDAYVIEYLRKAGLRTTVARTTGGITDVIIGGAFGGESGA